ncbi:unnamed protein product, partial [Mesorhabditis belari]|uniref:Uncharacterized protein n=1 Tax=Mesorhabditis belari TaxID=2138241 RepID=A0AAF3J5I2_9BILA
MWRIRVLTVVATVLLACPASASLFADGGASGSEAVDYDSLLKAQIEQQQRFDDDLKELYDQEMTREESEMTQKADYDRRLAEIVAQMGQTKEQLEVADVFGPETEQEPAPVKGEQPEKEQKESISEQNSVSDEKPVEKPQKKGQSEYVSFVEPEVVGYRQRDVQSLEKRRLAQSIHGNSYSPRGDSNLAMMAVGCVLVVGIVGGAIGGIAYRRRKESPDDSEYAPYAGIGPFRKGKKDTKGDDALAYKAQLHHYHQAKQKIICGDDAPVGLESDEEECPDDENNYSVYECPGLAPTGDIEVHNPNFAAQH